jgi:hypothetical protein
VQVAIYRFLRTEAYEPQDVERLAHAYELALLQLGLKDRNDPLTEVIAKLIIKIDGSGEHSTPQELCAAALKQLADAGR